MRECLWIVLCGIQIWLSRARTNEQDITKFIILGN